MPGFIDTHHHQFETALRSFLADGILINDGSGTPSARAQLLRVHPARRSRPSTGRRTSTSTSCSAGSASSTPASRRCTTSRRSTTRRSTPTPPSRRCSIPGAAPPSATSRAPAQRSAGNQYPQDATRIKKQWFSSSDQLVTHDHGRRGLPRRRDLQTRPGRSGASSGCRSRRTSSRRSASARSWTSSPRAPAATATTSGIGPDNLFIHMTGMSDVGWQGVKDVGAQVSIAFPIEMNMRHGMPPILKMQQLGMEPSLSTDVEMHHDGGLLHPDALRHEHAAHGREPDDPRARATS